SEEAARGGVRTVWCAFCARQGRTASSNAQQTSSRRDVMDEHSQKWVRGERRRGKLKGATYLALSGLHRRQDKFLRAVQESRETQQAAQSVRQMIRHLRRLNNNFGADSLCHDAIRPSGVAVRRGGL